MYILPLYLASPAFSRDSHIISTDVSKSATFNIDQHSILCFIQLTVDIPGKLKENEFSVDYH